MKITEIQIKNFGKLHNINIRPLSGLNVIYGGNETGKSTMHQFLTGMLFGMEKQQGRDEENDSYQQYEPWNSNSNYAGGLKFTVGGKPFYLERNFYRKEQSVKLINEEDSAELSVENGDLETLLGGMKKETYENTYCIGQASVETEKEFAGILQNFFVNASHGGEGNLDVVNAKKRLKERQKKAKQRYEELTAAWKEAEEKLILEERLLKDDVEQLQERQKEGYKPGSSKKKNTLLPEHDTNQMAEYLRDLRQQKEHVEYKVKGIIALLITMAVLLLGIWNGAAHLIDAPGVGWVILEIALLLVMLLGVRETFYWHQKLTQLKHLRIQQEEEAEEIRRYTSMEREKQRFMEQQDKQAKKEAVEEMLGGQLLEKQVALANVREDLEECRRPAEEEKEAARQMKAYELAYNTLESLSQNIHQGTREKLEQEMCRILSELTHGKYTRLELDEEMNLVTWDGERKVYPRQLSQGTMEQMYVAMRLGAGGVFSQEESMPILLDEVFASFDDKRLESMLKWLGNQPGQIFLFTCRKREMEILERNGIPYGKIMLSN